MNVPDVPVQVEVDPNEDTEWNDILRKHGILPEKPPSPTPMIEEALSQARQLAHENRLEGKDLDELAELEDEEDDDFLESYRQKRMAEMKAINSASVYNQVYHLQKPDYARDVTDASKTSFVLVLLTSATGGNVESKLMVELWRELARKFGDVKFCQIRADMCIDGYPERNTPTVLVYKDGDIKRQIVTLRELQGTRTSVEDIETILKEVGAVQHNDPRLRQKDMDGQDQVTRNSTIRQTSTRSQHARVDDEDSDWD